MRQTVFLAYWAAVLLLTTISLWAGVHDFVSASGGGGQLSLGAPSLASGQIVLPVTSGVATNPYSGFNAHVTFDGSKLAFASMASGGVLETTGATTFCVGVPTDGGSGATGSCNINGTQQTTASGTLANFTLNRLVATGCSVITIVTTGDSSTGSYTINSADSTAQANTYGTASLNIDLATAAIIGPWTVPTGDDDCDGFPSTVNASGRGRENFIGTDQNDRCPATGVVSMPPGADDEPIDAWPPDFNDNQLASLQDVILINPFFNSPISNPYSMRHDLNANGGVTLADVLLFIPFFNKTCVP